MSRSKLKARNTVSASYALNLNTTKAMFFVNDALLAATQDVFQEIEFTAAERSPVLDKATKERYPGENRDSISSSVSKVQKGVRARLVTKSGYGGFLELGTVKTRAQPYIWPAFEEHIGELPAALKARLAEIAGE
jgi:HK97 gp10 family phage protein